MSALTEYIESNRNFRQLCETKNFNEFENHLRKILLAARNSPNELWKIVKKKLRKYILLNQILTMLNDMTILMNS